MSGDVVLRNRVPAGVLDGHSRLLANGLEPDLDLGDLLRSKARLPPGATRVPGSQTVMRPISKTSPVTNVSVNRPPSLGSKASTPGELVVKRNRSFGCQHAPMSSTKAPNARSGVAATRSETTTRDITVAAPDRS